MTHSDLVSRAGRWLRNTMRCKLVILEPKPWNCHEHPDAIGWTPFGDSIVVECKVSGGDFAADWRKEWRLTSIGMGVTKYYLTPAGLLQDFTDRWIGDLRGVGLLEVHGRRVEMIREATTRPLHDYLAETNLLVAHISGTTKHERENIPPDLMIREFPKAE